MQENFTTLSARVIGSGPKLVCLHGFTQTNYSWGIFAQILANHLQLCLVDAPFHGESQNISASFEQAASLLARTGGTAHYLGYSMGGRIALRAALDYPQFVQSLTLISASPGIESNEERQARKLSDLELADSITETKSFVERWLGQPMFATMTPGQQDIESRMSNTPSGLANSLRQLGTGVQEPLWKRLGKLEMPVLILVGDNDDKFKEIGKQMQIDIGSNACIEVISGAGHNLYSEKPIETAKRVLEFIRTAPENSAL